MWDRLEAIATEQGFTVTRRDLAAEGSPANGVTNFADKAIVVTTDIDDAQAVKTLTHEVAHMLLHGPESQIRDEAIAHRGTAEVEAESVTFMVANQHGLDTSDYTFAYVAGWASGDAEAVMRSADNIMRAANHVLDRTQELDERAATTVAATEQQQQRAQQIQAQAEERAASLSTGPGEAAQLDRERYTEINEAAYAYYVATLAEPESVEQRRYLHERKLDGLIESTAENYRAGRAPDAWTKLTDHLRSQGYRDEDIRAAGVGILTKRGTTVDRFRDRIVLPIRDVDGRVIGLVGRTPDNRTPNVPKYLNSAESPHFHKRETVYGLDRVHTRREVSRIVITEGPMDAAALNEAARQQQRLDIVAVATAGTALTAVHAQQIREAAQENQAQIVLDFDPDSAGETATQRALEHFPADSVQVAARVPGRDPADIYAAMGGATVLATVEASQPAAHWQLDQLLANSPTLTPWKGRRGLCNKQLN